jgi:hypothetical protein
MPGVVQVVRILDLLSAVFGGLMFAMVLVAAITGNYTAHVSHRALLPLVPIMPWFFAALMAAITGLCVWLFRALGQGVRGAWTVSVVLFALGLAAIPIGTIINGLLLYFWLKPATKEWFEGGGRAAPTASRGRASPAKWVWAVVAAAVVALVAGGAFGVSRVMRRSSGGPVRMTSPHYISSPQMTHSFDQQAFDLRHAAMAGDVERLKELLSGGADPNGADPTGETPLHEAAAFGRKEAAAVLLEHGADPNARDSQGDTPLWEAVSFRKPEVAEVLLENGADASVKDDFWNETPLAHARKFRQTEMVKVLEAHGAPG